VPVIRPFRALRYADQARLRDLVSPPYDVISADHARALAARDPRNVVRLELPAVEPGDEPDERYRRAARALAAWRSDGTLRKERIASVYVYEQTYAAPGSGTTRTQRGFFGRLRLEALRPAGGVLPHERTMAGPREDRYRLLRATGVNVSPVVLLYEDPTCRSAALLERVASKPAEADFSDEEAVRHRVWVVPLGNAGEVKPATELIALAAAGPLTIADGHHRYETALRYRDERRMTRSCAEDPPFDYVLALFLEAAVQPLTVLPTHRLVLDLGEAGVEHLWSALPDVFDVAPASSAEVVAEMATAPGRARQGRFGLVTRERAALLTARDSAAFDPRADAPDPVAALDVTRLARALERVLDLDATTLASGERVEYAKSAEEAVARVQARTSGADAAFLLDPTPVGSVLAVARAREVMPQKSTYFYPKAMTGLVLNPLEP
jgi:uncharacterized protein (DUF1015 family)